MYYASYYYPGYYYSPQPYINQGTTYPTVVFSFNTAGCGQKHRTSNNISVPTGNYTIKAPQGVSFDIYLSKTGSDTKIGTYKNGAATSSKYPYPVPLTAGSPYYIANPSGASAPGFNVEFAASA